MDHNTIRHMLSEYIDGTVSDQEKAGIEAHLKTCQKCSDALSELRKTVEHIKTVEEVDPPAWMTQKIMTKVRAEAEEKKSIFEKLFFPLSVKLPIQAVAMAFLAVTAFYLYQNIQPTPKFAEAPVDSYKIKKESAAPSVIARSEQNKAEDSAPRLKQTPQAPGYNALDMKQEYEKPSLPSPKDQLASSAPARPSEQPAPEKKKMMLERRPAAPQALAPAAMQEQTTAAGAAPRAKAKSESIASLQKAKKPADKIEAGRRFERGIIERYSNGKPKLVVTYEIIDLQKVKLAEERFNPDGERHGIQKEYYTSGQLKTEAEYGDGKLEWYREYEPDGVKKIGKSDYDWFWLKK